MKENNIYLLQDPADGLFCKGGSLVHHKTKGNWSKTGKRWGSRKNFHLFLAQYFNKKTNKWRINMDYIVYVINLPDWSVTKAFYETMPLSEYITKNKVNGHEYIGTT